MTSAMVSSHLIVPGVSFSSIEISGSLSPSKYVLSSIVGVTTGSAFSIVKSIVTVPLNILSSVAVIIADAVPAFILFS